MEDRSFCRDQCASVREWLESGAAREMQCRDDNGELVGEDLDLFLKYQFRFRLLRRCAAHRSNRFVQLLQAFLYLELLVSCWNSEYGSLAASSDLYDHRWVGFMISECDVKRLEGRKKT